VTTIDEGYFYGPFGLTVAQGRSFVAYHDHAKQDMVLQVFEITQEWFMHRLEREGHDGWHSALTVGPIGSLHAVTIDPAGFNGDGIVYTTFAEGVFAPEIAVAGSINYDWGLSIDVASDGTVYVAFFDAAEGVAKVARRNGPDNWEVSVVEPVPSIYRESGRFPQIKVDESNNLYLAYLARSTTPNEGAIRYASGTFGNLTVQEVAMVSDIQVDDMFDFTELGMHGARNIVDLDLDSSGDPVLAYQSRSVTYIARWNGSGFDIEQLPVADGEELRQEVSMELDGADRIHLSFWIESATGPGQICYARR
jgi:hypothetical protein